MCFEQLARILREILKNLSLNLAVSRKLAWSHQSCMNAFKCWAAGQLSFVNMMSVGFGMLQQLPALRQQQRVALHTQRSQRHRSRPLIRAVVAEPPATAAAATQRTGQPNGRLYNFSAGPAVLPLPVLQQAQADLLNYQGSGSSVMEMSHRSKEFMGIIEKAEADLRTLLSIPDDYEVPIPAPSLLFP